MSLPALLIRYDPETWTPESVFCLGRTDEETMMLKELADMMFEAAKDRDNESN